MLSLRSFQENLILLLLNALNIVRLFAICQRFALKLVQFRAETYFTHGKANVHQTVDTPIFY